MDFKLLIAELLSGKTTKSFLAILGGTLLLFFLGFGTGRCSKDPTALPARIDTVTVDKPCPQVAAKKEDAPVVRPVPAVTAFKVSDWVCAWDRWTGVVIGISWSEKNPNLLIYEVQHYNENEEWVQLTYFDTELKLGKCQ